MATRDSRSHPHHPDPVLITLTEPKSAASEAFRTLRTNIQFAGLDQPCRSIVVTSAGPEEGKTTSAANFGVVSAQVGSRVCVVDSDLRRPTLHRLFKLSNTRGLTTALLENLSFAEVAQPTAVPNLSILPSGPLPPNPAELVGSHRMRECLRAATESFDLVLCDSPPLMAVGDAAALAAQCDGVIFVIRVGKTPNDVLRRVVDQIESVKGRILGVVLNRADPRRDGYYYYYQAYQRYYGADEGSTNR
jgi:capsular exopolysaccharide synthesis family protein